MSLVNDMLRDLEKRERSPGQASNAAAVMGDEPAQTRWLPLIILGVIVAVAVYFLEAPKPETRTTIAPLTIQVPQAQTLAQELDTQTASSSASEPQAEVETAVKNRVFSLGWQEGETQESLLLRFDAQPKLIVEAESDQILRLRLEDTLIGAAIPVLESTLISDLMTRIDGEDTQLEVSTAVPAEFSVNINNAEFELRIGVSPQAKVIASATEGSTSADTAERAQSAEPATDDTRSRSNQSATTEPLLSESEVAESEVAETEPVVTPEVSEARLEQRDDRQVVARARELIQQQQPEAAVVLLRAFIAEGQSAPQSRFLLAQLLLATQQVQAALNAAQQGFVQSEGSPEWRSLYGRILIQLNRLDEAASVLSGGTLDREGRELLAYVQQTRGNHARAVAIYLELLQEQSDQARWWIGLAISLEQGGDLQQARSAYENVLRLPNLESNLSRYAVEQLERLAAVGGQ